MDRARSSAATKSQSRVPCRSTAPPNNNSSHVPHLLATTSVLISHRPRVRLKINPPPPPPPPPPPNPTHPWLTLANTASKI